jgi:alpha-L-fucosidase
MEAVRESFDGAEPVDLGSTDKSIVLTRRGNSLYIHLLRDPETLAVLLHPLATLPKRATLLNSGDVLTADIAALPRWYSQSPPAALRIRSIPVNDATPYGRVLRLDFDIFPDAAKPPTKNESR